MRHIKEFEKVELKDGYPKIGDYVICVEDSNDTVFNAKLLIKFESENIGLVVDYRDRNNINSEFEYIPSKYNIFVQYDKIPDEVYDDFNYHKYIEYCRIFKKEEIIHSSKNKEELEHIIKAKKYNL